MQRVDNVGQIIGQDAVFRVNCVDCLDSTNVVQSLLARVVLETQLLRLGLSQPLGQPGVRRGGDRASGLEAAGTGGARGERSLPLLLREVFRSCWASNGDQISLQYVGTVALKGDYTRTGRRQLGGLIRDGVQSANRYVLRFNDAYRQLAYDFLTGAHPFCT